jgi:hypothetical protein
MGAIIKVLVSSSNGYSFITAGFLLGFFDLPEQAHSCAQKIKERTGKHVDVYGSKIEVVL